jgi:UDP-glucose 4-epimerase
MARALGVRRFVYVSSSEVYGTALYVPQPEDHPTYPMTVYGASKLAGECYARAYHRTYNFPTVVLRPFNTYGPRCHHEGDSGEVIPKFLLRTLAGKPMVIFGNGAQTRDFTYVTDTARGIMEAGLAEGAVGETINIGSGSELAIGELANQIRAVTGRATAQVIHEPERPGDVMRLCADTSKAQKQVGFQTSVPLVEGLGRLLAWYDKDGRTPEQLLADDWVRNWEVRV